MTAPRSTVRSRRRVSADSTPRTRTDIYEAMRAAGKDQDAWDAIRPDAVRMLAGKVKDVQLAARIFAVYRKRPHLMPARPPRNTPNTTTHSEDTIHG